MFQRNSILDDITQRLQYIETKKPVTTGFVTRFDGTMIETTAFPATVGTVCSIETVSGEPALAEMIGFRDKRNVLTLIEGDSSIVVGAKACTVSNAKEVRVGEGLLGRVMDGAGNPLDDQGPIMADTPWPLDGKLLNPLKKSPVRTPTDVGVKAINALLTMGKGQRVGIMAGSGVGKSVLLGMMVKYAQADVVVVALIGERGREVSTFIEDTITDETRDRTIMVAVPADHSPMLRIRGVLRATSIAEYFRTQGKDVLLIVDSLTRVGHAQREIGLALGEQPTAKGYPPSVIALLPDILERAGSDADTGGHITAIYTVLADGDDETDPIVDTARGILDGHFVLSRELAQRGHYPAINIGHSISRVFTAVATEEHQASALKFRALYNMYEENRDMIMMGGYEEGTDDEMDTAIALYPQLRDFVRQKESERVSYDDTIATLQQITPGGE